MSNWWHEHYQMTQKLYDSVNWDYFDAFEAKMDRMRAERKKEEHKKLLATTIVINSSGWTGR